MMRSKTIKKYFIFNLLIIFVTSFTLCTPVKAAGPLSEIQNELKGISGEEKKVLEKLFAMSHDIEAMTLQQEKYTGDIKSLNNEINTLKEAISNSQNDYDKKRDTLRQVLKIYQKKGPGTYLEIMLDSDALNTILWKINTLQDLSYNTGKLLKSLDKTSKELSDKKHKLDEKLKLAKSEKAKLKESLDKQLELKSEMENYLSSLNQKKGYYSDQLEKMVKVWDNLKLLFSNASDEFIHIIKYGNVPYDDVKLDFTYEGIEGTIDENTFNKIISTNPTLSQMKFSFDSGKVEINVPESGLVLDGTFLLADEGTLKFEAHEGSFYGMPLEENAIEELFSDGDIVVDLKSLLNSSLSKLEISDGALKFIINSGL